VKTLLRWVGAVFAALAFAMLLMIAVGTSLPMYHVATCSAVYAQSAPALFSTVEDDASSPTWRSDVTKVVSMRGERGKRVWVETNRNGQTVAYAEYQRILNRGILRGIEDLTLPYGGLWAYSFRPSGSGTTVTITETGWIYNPIFRLVEHFVTGYTGTIHTYLVDLGRKYAQTPAISCTSKTYSQGIPK
jgi:hypothetical protein